MSKPEKEHENSHLPVDIYDLTEHDRTDAKLQTLFRAVESCSSSVIITSTDGVIEYVNPRFSKITGYAKDEAAGENIQFLKSSKTPDTVYAELWNTITSGDEWKGTIYNRRKDGSDYRARIYISPVVGDDGQMINFICIQDDVTRELELTEQLRYQACHDALTGLVSGSEFERRAARLLSTVQRDKSEHALCLMNLDRFNIVIDTCGRFAGDALLHQLGNILQGAVRQRDTLARLGGDEFAVLMERCKLDQAHRVAEALQQAVHDYQFVWEGQSFRIGLSIGLVAISETTSNLTELLKQADTACYMAKDLGHNHIHQYHLEDTALALLQGEVLWLARIKRALKEDRFCLYAQIIVPLNNGAGKHYELLLRMVDEDGVIIPPGDFLPAAERYDLMRELDSWVIENAFKFLSTHPDFVDQIEFISINLSGPSLTNSDFLDFIIAHLSIFEINPRKICFEITETAAIPNFTVAMVFISTLKNLGCRFALDDFGSGLASFGYLKNLPVDYLKIDGIFVKDIVDEPIDRSMVKSINDIGQIMGMQTIAEFVENDEIVETLKAIGVDFAQGYGLGKPQPLDHIIDQREPRKARE